MEKFKVNKHLSKDKQTAINDHQHVATVGEKVMVEIPTGFKFGNVKYTGPTEFSPGEWIGVSLEQPANEYVVGFGY